MSELTVGVTELKSNLSKYLRHVKAGRTLVITVRGTPVARMVPAAALNEGRLQAAVDAGLAKGSGQPLPPVETFVRNRGSKTVAELLIEERR